MKIKVRKQGNLRYKRQKKKRTDEYCEKIGIKTMEI